MISLSVPSRAERDFDKSKSISDMSQKEKACREALSSLASGGRRNRIINGIISSAFSAYILANSLKEKNHAGGNLTLAAVFGGSAVYEFFLRKTPEEKAYRGYLRESQEQKELALRVGIMPHGGVKIGFTLSY